MERPPTRQSWVAALLVLALVGAVCWLAYNTDATRIEVPGVITWERSRAEAEPEGGRRSRRMPTDRPECIIGGPSVRTMPVATARTVRSCNDVPDPDEDGP